LTISSKDNNPIAPWHPKELGFSQRIPVLWENPAHFSLLDLRKRIDGFHTGKGNAGPSGIDRNRLGGTP
jgi:hypothetical protein